MPSDQSMAPSPQESHPETTQPSGDEGDAPATIPRVPADAEARGRIEAHIEHYLGKSALFIREPAIVNDGFDLHILPPSMLYPFYTLVTVGMSDLAMPTPAGAETYRNAEMLLALPSSWPMDTQAWRQETNYWPIRLVRALARMPYLSDTWVRPGYALAHGGEPPRPYARNTRLCGAFVTAPIRYEPNFLSLVVRPDKVVRFHSFIPLYREELDFCHQAGPRALRMRLTERRVTELLDIRRKRVVGRRWFGRG